MKVVQEYLYANKEYVERTGERGHRYIKDYSKSDWFCPNCGKQEVWTCNDGGDYYVGEESVCLSCGKSSYLDHCGGKANEAVVRQLKTGITDTPTTPLGN